MAEQAGVEGRDRAAPSCSTHMQHPHAAPRAEDGLQLPCLGAEFIHKPALHAALQVQQLPAAVLQRGSEAAAAAGAAVGMTATSRFQWCAQQAHPIDQLLLPTIMPVTHEFCAHFASEGCMPRATVQCIGRNAARQVFRQPLRWGRTCARSRTHSGSQRSSLSVKGSMCMMWSCREERCGGGSRRKEDAGCWEMAGRAPVAARQKHHPQASASRHASKPYLGLSLWLWRLLSLRHAAKAVTPVCCSGLRLCMAGGSLCRKLQYMHCNRPGQSTDRQNFATSAPGWRLGFWWTLNCCAGTQHCCVRTQDSLLVRRQALPLPLVTFPSYFSATWQWRPLPPRPALLA